MLYPRIWIASSALRASYTRQLGVLIPSTYYWLQLVWLRLFLVGKKWPFPAAEGSNVTLLTEDTVW